MTHKITLDEISATLNTLNAEVSIFRSAYPYDDERWSCTITIEKPGTSLKVRATGPLCTSALQSAYANLLPLISAPSVAGALSIPSLSAPEIDLESLPLGAAE